jgi:Tol biopolymer transport system component
MKRYFLTLMMGLLSGSLFAGYTAKWVNAPAISPNGKTLVFGYMGNLYSISPEGGAATALTTGKDYNTRPVWSPDGKTIAFASDRSGNFDVYVMPAGGGIPTQLTYNSANDYPYDFTKDGAKVLFGSGHDAPASSVRFPGPGYFLNLYTVPVIGGRPLLLSAAGADFARYNASGTKIVFQDKKGYEDNLRKHHQSAITRDLWSFEPATGQYTQLTTFSGEDREPFFDPKDDRILYYLNEKDGTQNLYKLNLADKSEIQLTHFKDYPVRSLSASETGTLAFVWKGDLYTVKEGSQPQRVDLNLSLIHI